MGVVRAGDLRLRTLEDGCVLRENVILKLIFLIWGRGYEGLEVGIGAEETGGGFVVV